MKDIGDQRVTTQGKSACENLSALGRSRWETSQGSGTLLVFGRTDNVHCTMKDHWLAETSSNMKSLVELTVCMWTPAS